LRGSFDIDWFRNPRAIESVLEQSAVIELAATDPPTVEQQQTAAAKWLLESIES
jgi:hypothetical protein